MSFWSSFSPISSAGMIGLGLFKILFDLLSDFCDSVSSVVPALFVLVFVCSDTSDSDVVYSDLSVSTV